MRELSLHILDIAENSLRANANLIQITINEDTKNNTYQIIIEDNGIGMTKERSEKVMDPFVTERTTRKVGLGLPLFASTAKRCAGDVVLHSILQKGTKVIAKMERDHIDLPPLGKISDTISSLIHSSAGCDIVYTHKVDEFSFTLDTREVKKQLGDVPLNDPLVTKWISDYIRENENYLRKKGALS